MSKRRTFARRARTLRAERRRAVRVGPMGGVAAPVALFYELSALLYETQSDSFTVSAANLARTTACRVSLSAVTAGGTNVSGNDVGFNSTCSTAAKTLTIPANSAAYSTTITLYACDDEGGGGAITAQLKAGATAVDSASQFVSVRALSVEASVSDPFPSSGDSVTLTASVDGPSGATYTYQWQQKSGASWANISGATASTLSRSFSTRGTRVFRVRATYGSTSATSEAVMPTWDATKIVVDMLSAMERRVVALSVYTTAQTAFLNCVQRRTGTSLASFDAALDRYAGRTKTAVDACETSGAPRSGALPALARTTMFATYQRLSKQELAAMRRTNSEYDLFLSTEPGREFLDYVGSPKIVKRYAGYIAQSGGGGAGVSGQASVTGFDCIPATAPSSLSGKLRALNCLIFDTPHSWWRTNGLTIENRIKSATGWSQYKFLGTAADKCTKFFDGPVPSCRKHDVAVGSLPKFRGTSDGSEIDEAWHPVNKYLADSKFYRDIETYGCESPSLAARLAVCGMERKAMANVYYWGVAQVNSKGWPIASQDVERANYDLDEFYNPRFTECSSPFIPNLSDGSVTRSGASVTVRWKFSAGCAVGFDDVNFYLIIEDDYRVVAPSCTKVSAQFTCTYTYSAPNRGGYAVHIEPKNWEYGSRSYPSALLLRAQPR